MIDRPHCLNQDACVASGRGTHCRSCAVIAKNKSPEQRASVSAKMKIKSPWRDPEWRARHCLSPEANAIRAQKTKAQMDALSPEERSELAKRGRRKLMAWAGEYLSTYRHLTQVKKLSPAEARAAVMEMRQADGRREIARIRSDMERKAAREREQAY